MRMIIWILAIVSRPIALFSSDSMEEKEIALAESKNAGKMRLKHKSMTKQFLVKK